MIVAGAAGMVGSSVCRRLEALGVDVVSMGRNEVDFVDYVQVASMYARHADANSIVIAAAKVGGIHANSKYPAEFIYQNLMIEANLIHGAFIHGIPQVMFLGSSCIYPRLAEQPISETSLLTGRLETTNEPYAVAKIAGIKLCESYHRQYGLDCRSLMPTNLYGPHDNFVGEDSHVIPALLKKFVEANVSGSQSVEVWGTGNARREFLHVDDLARAVEFFMMLPPEVYWSAVSPQHSHINIGTGSDISIRELAELLKHVTGFEGELRFDDTRPDGAPRKLLDVSKAISLGWKPTVDLRDGLEETFSWYQEATGRDSVRR